MKNYRGSKNFPNPLAPQQEKESKSYGLRYAKAIESQWGKKSDSNSIFRRRYDLFEKNRKYANGTQDTNIYKKLLNNLDPNSGDGSLINIDYTPVPILPKFVKIVVNKILARDPYPNLEAIDPLSSSEKDKAKKKLALDLEKESKEIKDEATAKAMDEESKQLIKATRKLRQFILDSVDDGK